MRPRGKRCPVATKRFVGSSFDPVAPQKATHVSVPCRGGCNTLVIVPIGEEEKAWCGSGVTCIRKYREPEFVSKKKLQVSDDDRVTAWIKRTSAAD